MEHQELTEEISEQLALYALDALDEASTKAWQAHLATGCQACVAELEKNQSAMTLLAYSVPLVSPPPRLKARFMERVKASSAAVVDLPRTRRAIDFSALLWQSSGYPGVSLHSWRQDDVTGTFVALVKIQPGCTYADHVHPGGEDCLVLQGGFRDHRGQYRAGDFVYYEPGSVHKNFQALEGEECVLMVVAHGGLQLLQEAG
jgi:quercetin dioxygenase-like cupin family protein